MSEGNWHTASVPSNGTGDSVYNRQPNGTFGPGNVANPGGRPKAIFTRAGIAELRDSMADDGGAKARALMARLYEAGMDGDIQAARLFMETIQGRPTQSLEHSGNAGIVKVLLAPEGAR